MPELPEVETTLRGIDPHLRNRFVREVIIREHRLRWPIAAEIGQRLTGLQIRALSRRAKYLFLETDCGSLMIHLGMSGSLRILTSAIAPGKHDHVDVVFDGGVILRFNDPRRFGSLHWIEQGHENGHRLLRHLGIEPLANEFSGQHLHTAAQNRTLAVKNFIMDQSVVVGVGNIYANESLFSASISPLRRARRISRARYDRLATCIKDILADAIRMGGTTLKDFTRESGQPGYFKQSLQVYGREGLPCCRCGTQLTATRVGQRSTFYCRSCQT